MNVLYSTFIDVAYDRYLCRGQPKYVLAGLANCSWDRVHESLKEWVPKWYTVAKALTRLTWLGEYPKLVEKAQPRETANARRRRKDVAARKQEVNDDGNERLSRSPWELVER